MIALTSIFTLIAFYEIARRFGGRPGMSQLDFNHWHRNSTLRRDADLLWELVSTRGKARMWYVTGFINFFRFRVHPGPRVF